MCVTEKPSQAWMKWVVGKGFIIFVFVLFSGLDGWCVNTNIYIYTHTHIGGTVSKSCAAGKVCSLYVSSSFKICCRPCPVQQYERSAANMYGYFL